MASPACQRVSLAAPLAECVHVRREGVVAARHHRGIVFLALVVVCLVLLPSPSGAQQLKPVRRVLVIHELGLASPAMALLDQNLIAVLDNGPYQIELYREYLETTLFSDAAVQEQFRQAYIQKYRNRPPDLIIVLGPSALKLMSGAHEQFFKHIPVVFGATSEDEAGHPRLDTEFTGIWQTWEPQKTLEVALKLHPDIAHVYVVGGTSNFDRNLEAIFKEHLRSYESKLEISYLIDLDMPGLLERLKNLPAHSIVLLTHMGQDAVGTRYLGASQADPMIAAAANAPVFGPSDVDLGHGEVGGNLGSFAADGHRVGGIALRVLNGEKPQDIPITTQANPYIFDWRALQRWGFSEASLPVGSTVLFRQPTFWEAYRRYVLAAIALFLIQTAIIVALFWQWRVRKNAQEDLALANERLRLAMECAKAVSWNMDIKKGRTSWFGALENMFGETSATFTMEIGEFYNYVHEEDRKRLAESVTRGQERHEPFVAEFRTANSNGTAHWFSARGKFTYRGDGQATRMLGMAVDITERKMAEEKVRESQERVESIIASAMDAIIAIDTDHRIVVFNAAAESMFGCSAKDALFSPIEQFIPQRFRVGHRDSVRQFARTETTNRAMDGFGTPWGLRANGEEFPIEASISQSSAGDKKLLIVIIRDITQRRQAEELLASVSRKLIEAQEQERTWIARELHDDVTQRLALLAVNLGMLKGTLPDSAKKARHALNELADMTKELGNDVQALSHRLHSSKLEYLGLGSAAASFCRELAERQGVEIDFQSDTLPKNLSTETSVCLYRVLQEALQNAVKHSGSRQFQVSLNCSESEISMTVSDSGKGFNPEDALKSRGLGITSMRERLKLIDGRFSIESGSHGTVVRAAAPIAQIKSAAATTA